MPARSLWADCTFGTLSASRYYAGDHAADIATGYFNNDPFVDLAIVNRQSPNITILLGLAGGRFMTSTTIVSDYSQGDIMAGDINGDDNTDLAISIEWSNNFTIYPHVKTLLGNGNGTFTPMSYTKEMLVFQNPQYLEPGDFNHDGRTDAIATKTDDRNIAVLIAGAGGYLVQKAEYTTLEAGEPYGLLEGVTSGDFDGDGNLDFAAADETHSRVVPFFGVGDGTFFKGTVISIVTDDPNDHAWTLAGGDLNGDGKDDLAIGLNDRDHGTDSPLMVALSNGNARTFAVSFAQSGLKGLRSLAVTDVDGDGNRDVIVAQLNEIAVFLGNGDGTLDAKRPIPGMASLDLAIADVDRDGGLDFIGTDFSPGVVTVALNTCARVALNVSSTANPVTQANDFTVTGTAVAPPTATPTGTLTIERAGTLLGTHNLSTGMSISSTGNLFNPGTYEYTVTYSGDSRFASGRATLQQVVQPPPFGPPPGLNASSVGGPVQLTWIATSGTRHYEIWRSQGSGYSMIGLSGTAAYTDTGAPSSAALLYKVRAVSLGFELSSLSAPDLTITHPFTDESLTGQTVKGAHFSELRDAVNAVRALAGLPAASFGSSSVVLASHVNELRAALNEARSAIGLRPLAYTDAALTPFVTQIKAAHLLELRNGMR